MMKIWGLLWKLRVPYVKINYLYNNHLLAIAFLLVFFGRPHRGGSIPKLKKYTSFSKVYEYLSFQYELI